MQPLLSEEPYATVYHLSYPSSTIQAEKKTDHDRYRHINPPTSQALTLLRNKFSEIPQPPATALLALPVGQRQDLPQAPIDPTVEIPGPSQPFGRISTQLSIIYKKQLGHRVQYTTSEIPDKNPLPIVTL